MTTIRGRTRALVLALTAALIGGGVLVLLLEGSGSELPPPEEGYQEFYENGMAHMKPGLWGDAIPNLVWATRIDPRQTMGHYQLSVAYQNSGDPERALDAINVVLEEPEHLRRAERSPVFHKLFEERGHILSNLGRYEESKADFRKVVELRPDEASTYYFLCWTHLALTEMEEALEAGLKALELGYRTHEAYYKVGMACKKLGRHEEAVEHFRAAIAKNPGYARAYQNLAQSLFKLGKREEGKSTNLIAKGLAEVDDQMAKFRQRMSLSKPTDENYQPDMEAYALFCFEYWKYPELEESMEKLLSLHPNRADYHFKLAYAKAQLTKEKKADWHFRRTIHLLRVKEGEPTLEDRSLAISASNALAFLLASAEDPEVRKPSEALLRANEARLMGYRGVDILAEALRASGQIGEALELVNEAAGEGGEGGTGVYDMQRRRFQELLRKKGEGQPDPGDAPEETRPPAPPEGPDEGN